MRVRILSDLHVDFGGEVHPERGNEDAVIVAGDACEGVAGIHWAAGAFPAVPVVYVPGNHEYYGAEYGAFRAAMRDAAQALSHPAFRLLDDAATTIDGVRIIGSTLWTDFRLYGGSPAEVARAMSICKRQLLDYRHISVRGDDGAERLLEPEDTLLWHRRARQYLSLALASGDPARTLVVTHHGPHRRSLAPRFADDLTSAGFLSDLSPLLGRAALWVHGHTHTSFDYVVGRTRVVCNPRGYCAPDGSNCENPEFRWDLMAEI
jgi:predicted phosphodiesterase